MNSGVHHATSWLCPDPSDRARTIAVNDRLARFVNYGLNAVVTVVLAARYGWWTLIPVSCVIASAESLLLVARNRPRAEWWQFASQASTLPWMGLVAALQGGARSPYLLFTVVSSPFFAVRFGLRGGLAGTTVASVVVVAASAIGSGAAMFSFPEAMMMTLLLQWSIAVTIITLVRDERRSREGARRDHLTGLLNRRALDEELEVLVSLAKRSDRWLAAMYIDVDHFKTLNDRFGHRVGDSTLAKIGEVLAERMRVSDRCIRAGGDEFIVLLPDTGPGDAVALGERIRSALTSELTLPDGTPVTVSVGVAALRGPELDGSTLLHEADLALYGVKAAGRNAVGSHQIHGTIVIANPQV
jgi:diguanylate cyclase (GGDEF)-like protein